MALTTLTKEEFRTYSDQVSSRSFMQSVQMGDLLEKRGARIVYLALKQEGEIRVVALVYSLPMLGGAAYGAQFGSDLYPTRCSSSFLCGVKRICQAKWCIRVACKTL